MFLAKAIIYCFCNLPLPHQLVCSKVIFPKANIFCFAQIELVTVVVMLPLFVAVVAVVDGCLQARTADSIRYVVVLLSGQHKIFPPSEILASSTLVDEVKGKLQK